MQRTTLCFIARFLSPSFPHQVFSHARTGDILFMCRLFLQHLPSSPSDRSLLKHSPPPRSVFLTINILTPGIGQAGRTSLSRCSVPRKTPPSSWVTPAWAKSEMRLFQHQTLSCILGFQTCSPSLAPKFNALDVILTTVDGHLIKAYCGTVNDKVEVCPNFKDKLAAGCSNYVWAEKFGWRRSEKEGRMHRRRCKYNTPEGLCLQVSCGR